MMVTADRIRALTRQPMQETAPAPTMETDGISLLREWAAEARTRASEPDAAPDLAVAAPWEAPLPQALQALQPAAVPEATNSEPGLQPTLTVERLAEELCLRLLDAAGNM